jgi:hypothetical protein
MIRIYAAAVAVVVAVACDSAEAAKVRGPDPKPFQALVRAGLAETQNAFVPDPAICPGPVPGDVRDGLVSQIPSRMAAYFAQPQLDKEVSIATRVVRSNDGPACMYGGGVDWVRLDHLTIQGDASSASGQARLWAKFAQWQGTPVFAEPHNTLDITCSFLKVGGRWLISLYEWHFAPGSEP